MPGFGESRVTSGPGNTVRIGSDVALCPSGLMIVTAFCPDVALTVEIFIVSDVGLVKVTLFTMAPGNAAESRQPKPGPGSKNSDPADEVAVTWMLIDAAPPGTIAGETLTGSAGGGPVSRAARRPYESAASAYCCSAHTVMLSQGSTEVAE